MRTTITVLFLMAFSFTSPAQEPVAVAPEADPRLELLAADLHALSRIAELSESLRAHRELMLAIVEDEISRFREPLGDGTYRWADLDRVEESRVRREDKIKKVHSETELDTVSLKASHAYQIVVALPQKRSLFHSNKKIFVRKALVQTTHFDGSQKTDEIPVHVWIEPGDAHSIPLSEIAASAVVTVELGVETGSQEGVSEVALLQAKLVDDPRSPYWPAVTRLLDVRRVLSRSDPNASDLKQQIDEAISVIPGELEKSLSIARLRAEERRALMSTATLKERIEPGDATPDVVHELQEITRALGGTLEEQTKARERLLQLIGALRIAPAESEPAAETTSAARSR